MPPKIIGIAGTNGSGKDTVGQILEQDHNYLFVSVSDMLRKELKQSGKPLTRKASSELSGQWRRQYGLGVMIDKAIAEYERAGGKQHYSGLAIASLRSPAEPDRVHEMDGIVLWLDGDPQLRYQRIKDNAAKRGQDRAATDSISFAKFMADETIEMGEADNIDPTALSMSRVKSKSDLFLTNDGNDLELLRNKLNQLLGFSPNL